VHDIKQAEALIEGFDFDKLLADKGYDSNQFRGLIAAAGAEAVMPSNRARSQAIPYDKVVYRDRNLVERFFNKIKHCRRVATRYDKLAANYLAFIQLASIRLWLRVNESTS
jgi:transposase